MGYDPYANYYTILNGNFIDEDLCIPKRFFRILMTIIFPPLGVFYTQLLAGFPSPSKILVTLILTIFFYFPGLIYGLNNLEVYDNTSNQGYELDEASGTVNRISK
jgi:uncharacterized membrane protein YqaE (UPF0057 family)